MERSDTISSASSADCAVAPSSHHSKCSKTSGLQATRKPPSHLNPNSSSDFASNSRKTLCFRYEVWMTNRLLSFPTYTGRQPAGTSGKGLEHSSSESRCASGKLPHDRLELAKEADSNEHEEESALWLLPCWLWCDFDNTFCTKLLSFFVATMVHVYTTGALQLQLLPDCCYSLRIFLISAAKL